MKILILSRGNSYPQRQIKKEAEKLGHEVEIANYKKVNITYENSEDLAKAFRITTETGKDLNEFDYIVPRGPLNYRHIIQMIAKYADIHEIPMLNKYSILNYPIFDKSIQYALLSIAGIPIIPAMVDHEENNFEEISAQYGKPFVYKYTKGATGIHVYKIESQEEMDELPVREKRLKDRWYLAQKFWPAGSDYRVAVIGGKVVGAMKRTAVAKDEFRANFSLGGSVEAAEVTPEMEEIAIKCARATKCDYLGVDIMFWEEKPYVLEVNRYFHFDGFDKSHEDIQIAQILLNYIESSK